MSEPKQRPSLLATRLPEPPSEPPLSSLDQWPRERTADPRIRAIAWSVTLAIALAGCAFEAVEQVKQMAFIRRVTDVALQGVPNNKEQQVIAIRKYLQSHVTFHGAPSDAPVPLTGKNVADGERDSKPGGDKPPSGGRPKLQVVK